MDKTLDHDGLFYRAASVSKKSIDEEARTVELAFSSEAPVERWFGTEILDHSSKAVRLDRLEKGGPVLVDHDHRDHVGVIEKVEIGDDRKGRAVVRFGQSARAKEIFQDVLDGIRGSVSVGYVIHELVEKTKDAVFRATDWEPHEVSFVSVPADVSVGVGRQKDFKQQIKLRSIPTMDPQEPKTPAQPDPVVVADPKEVKRAASAMLATERDKWKEIRALATDAAAREDDTKRVDEIRQLGESAIEEGLDVDQFRDKLLRSFIDSRPAVKRTVSDPDLTPKEQKRFSVTRVLNALANPGNRQAQAAAAFEFDVSSDIAKRTAQEPQGAFLPGFAFKRQRSSSDLDALNAMIRVLTAGTATDGAELVATDLKASEFIDVLRNATTLMEAGARALDGLVGDVAIPRKSAASQSGWITPENDPAGQSEPQFDQVTLTPRTVGAWGEYSRQLLLQSTPSIDGLLQDDLTEGVGIAIDLAGYEGTGAAGQPTGIVGQAGVQTTAVVAAGAPTWAEFVAFETLVATANAALGSLNYVTTPAVVGNLKTTEKATGTAQFIMDSSRPAQGNIRGTANGYNVLATNQLAANRIIFGNFADVLIGMWGTLDVLVDPYTGGTRGTVRIIALQSADVAARRGPSFCIPA